MIYRGSTIILQNEIYTLPMGLHEIDYLAYIGADNPDARSYAADDNYKCGNPQWLAPYPLIRLHMGTRSLTGGRTL